MQRWVQGRGAGSVARPGTVSAGRRIIDMEDGTPSVHVNPLSLFILILAQARRGVFVLAPELGRGVKGGPERWREGLWCGGGL